MVQFPKIRPPSFAALFYVVLFTETLWFGLLIDPVMQSGSEIGLARINETYIYDVAAEHEGLHFLYIEYGLGIICIIFQFLSIIALSIGHHLRTVQRFIARGVSGSHK